MAGLMPRLSPDARRVLAEWPLLIGFAVLAVPALITLGADNWSTEAGSDGPIILATGAWLLWRAWPAFVSQGVPGRGWVTAAMLVPALVCYILGRAYDFETLAMLGVWGAGLAMLQSRFGGTVLRASWFPFLYLGFLIPPPEFILHAVTAPLKIFVSHAATVTLALAGLPVVSHGVAIEVGSYQLLVEEACSGMNSILGLLAVGLFYIHLMHGSSVRRSLILTAALIPIAILANIVRIMILILLTYFAGNDAAQGFLHGFAGMVVFTVALGLVFGFDQLVTAVVRRQGAHP
jgi:exosortase